MTNPLELAQELEHMFRFRDTTVMYLSRGMAERLIASLRSLPQSQTENGGREAALEEAAKIADEYYDPYEEGHSMIRSIAREIRALKSEPLIDHIKATAPDKGGTELVALKKPVEEEEIDDHIADLEQFLGAYPIDIFPEATSKQIDACPENVPGRISAMMGRHLGKTYVKPTVALLRRLSADKARMEEALRTYQDATKHLRDLANASAVLMLGLAPTSAPQLALQAANKFLDDVNARAALPKQKATS